jgi:GAF domain-containing protein
MTDYGQPGDLAAAYSELQNLLMDSPEVTDFLEQVAVLAASVVGGVSSGITLRRDQELTTIATSDDFALQVDEIQYGRGQGPCLETLHSGHAVAVPDLASDERWRDYRVHALAHGVRSSLSLPLTVEDRVIGALNLYATEAHHFDAAASVRAEAFARQTCTALAIVQRNAERTVLEDQLREALATRAVVDQAVGILMGQQRIGADEAFGVLRQASQTRNRKLRDIAADLIEAITGEPPRPPRPFTEPR